MTGFYDMEGSCHSVSYRLLTSPKGEARAAYRIVKLLRNKNSLYKSIFYFNTV